MDLRHGLRPSAERAAGTLFGRNTTGGAVLYYPAAPGYEWEGYLQADYGNFDHKQLEGAFTLPMVTDRLSVASRAATTSATGIRATSDWAAIWMTSIPRLPRLGAGRTDGFDPQSHHLRLYRNYYTGDGAILLNVNDAPSLLDLLGIKESAQAALAAQKAGGPAWWTATSSQP
ncbi:hypothetical protein [Novosphingobium resinovorum]|uniref:hypothetical protein n=1 Tax=Novosphingobium resinovorum TaxID=158500 RepID=UPI003D29C9D7